MAEEDDVARVARHLADLRMQVSSLEASAKLGSPQEMLKQTRSTVRWSAIIVALALLGSALIKLWSDKRVEALEKRVELLEKYHQAPPTP